MKTTLDIDEPILRELKRRQAKEGKSLGRLVSDLLARVPSNRSGLAPAARRYPGDRPCSYAHSTT